MSREVYNPQAEQGNLQLLEIEGLEGGFALLFPGQGIQTPGMGRELLGYEKVTELYEKADSYLRDRLDLTNEQKENFSLLNLSAEDLKRTDYAQLAIFTHTEACRIALNERRESEGLPDLKPKFYAGNSLGEYNALYAAGAFESLEDALFLLTVRGREMQKACFLNPGSLCAVSIRTRPGFGTTREQEEGFFRAKDCLTNQELGLYLEADNSREQFVFGGTIDDLAQAEVWFREQGFDQIGLKITGLNVAGVFHSELMRPAVAECEKAVRLLKREGRIKKTKVPVISNVTGKPIRYPFQIADELVNHITKPVLWRESMGYLDKRKISATIELGNKNPLTSMMKDKGVSTAVKVGVGAAAAGLVIGTVLTWKRRQSKGE